VDRFATALHLACEYNRPKSVQLLIEAGLNIEVMLEVVDWCYGVDGAGAMKID
jgi:Ankyrin repeat